MSSSSSSLDPDLDRYNTPLLRPKQPDTPKDWVKIGAIVAAVIGGLITALAVCCIMGYLPKELLGSPLGRGITLVVGASILLPAAFVLFDKWRNS